MNDQDIRAIVRDAIARHVTAGATIPPRAAAAGGGAMPGLGADDRHASQLRFVLESGGDVDGACLIEPAVRCTHCGYCQSFGH